MQQADVIGWKGNAHEACLQRLWDKQPLTGS